MPTPIGIVTQGISIEEDSSIASQRAATECKEEKVDLKTLQNNLFYLREAKFVTNQRLLNPTNRHFYRVMKSDFTAPTMYKVNIVKTRPRVFVKTFVPLEDKRKIVENGLEINHFENRRKPPESVDVKNQRGLTVFQKKFYSNAHSS